MFVHWLVIIVMNVPTLFVTIGVIPAGSRRAIYASSTTKYESLDGALTTINGILTSPLLSPYIPIPKPLITEESVDADFIRSQLLADFGTVKDI